MRAGVTSGGRGLDGERARAAKRAGVDSVSISLDGLEAAHDRQRGVRGSFAAGLSALGHLREAGVPFSANSQVNRLSFAIGALGHRLGVKAHLDRERHQLGLPPGPETWDHILYRNLVVASEPALAPLPADVRPGRWVLQPGAFYLEEDEAPQAAVAAFVEEGPPPVYLGFGSMPDVVPGATLGWVTRAADAAEVRVVLQGPQAGRSGRVLTVPEVSHRWLFPRCAGVVHHGGAGTTARAARCGVPQVLVPHVTDQFYWRERLRRLGVLGRHDLTVVARRTTTTPWRVQRSQ